jgi:hypothetical protein
MIDASNSNMQTTEGPGINELHHRLTEFPPEWLDQVAPDCFSAIIHDVLLTRCNNLRASKLAPFQRPVSQCDWYRLSLLIAYFIADDGFARHQFSLATLTDLLENTAQELASAGPSEIYINDVDRRDEFIRVVLNAIGLRPKGESQNQSEDRLQAASSRERNKVLKATRTAQERTRKIRQALAKQKAQEAADKMMRE